MLGPKSLCSYWSTMNACRHRGGGRSECRLIASLFITSALEGDEWSALRSGHFISEESSGAHLIRGWVGPRTGLDAVEKRKISVFLRNGTPSPLPYDPSSSYYTYWNIPVYYHNYYAITTCPLYDVWECKERRTIYPLYVNIAECRIEIFLFIQSRFWSPPWPCHSSSG
jgi:hypothetical protein